MRVFISCDSDWDSKVRETLEMLTDTVSCEYFREQDYGSSLDGISVFYICRDPKLCLRRRVRLSKAEKKLYMDIMLDLPAMKAADWAARKRVIAERLVTEIPEVVGKYRLPDFDTSRFVADLRGWVAKTGWI